MNKILIFIALAAKSSSAYASGSSEIFSDPITNLIVLIILGVAVVLHVRYDRYTINHGPEILTTIGIFGCFLGIAFAMLKFNPENVTQSVPDLLNGVKTAFIASVFGVAAALTVKFRHAFLKDPKPKVTEEPKSASLEDVVSSLNGLRKSIAGENDTSLISQIRLMRQEQNDSSAQLKKSFDEFADKVSELGSKALIAALEKVIKDFNTQLNEQFGDNFKQLNSAVEKLVIWQQQYKVELDNQQQLLKRSAEGLDRSASSLSVITERAKAYTDTADDFASLLKSFGDQYSLMKQGQEALFAVLSEMKAIEPSFSKKLSDLTETFKSGTDSITASVNQQVKTLSDQIQLKNNEFSELITKKIPEIQENVNVNLKKSQDKLSENFVMLEKNLEIELQKALMTLGQQLASLSEKFVSDYGPLTEKLKTLVNMSRGI
jgi:hypothetical protein